MTGRYTGKAAVIFGGARGIGKATAMRLAQEGARVLVCDVLEDEGAATGKELAGISEGSGFFACDVGDPERIEAAITRAMDDFGQIDVLFNNVGIVRYAQPHELSFEDWDLVMGVNLRAQFAAAKFVLPHMIEAGRGVIVNTASVLAHGSQKNTVAYATSKAGILGLTRSLAVEYADKGIRAVSISPGTIDTPINRLAAASFGDDVEKVIAGWGRMHPAGRVGTAEEVAALVAYLASDEAGFVTGTDYPIDGGIRAGLYN